MMMVVMVMVVMIIKKYKTRLFIELGIGLARSSSLLLLLSDRQKPSQVTVTTHNQSTRLKTAEVISYSAKLYGARQRQGKSLHTSK